MGVIRQIISLHLNERNLKTLSARWSLFRTVVNSSKKSVERREIRQKKYFKGQDIIMNSSLNFESYIVITIQFWNGKQKKKPICLRQIFHFLLLLIFNQDLFLQFVTWCNECSESDFGSLNSKSWWVWSIVLNNTQIVFIRWQLHDVAFHYFRLFKWSNRHCINKLLVIFETFNLIIQNRIQQKVYLLKLLALL